MAPHSTGPTTPVDVNPEPVVPGSDVPSPRSVPRARRCRPIDRWPARRAAQRRPAAAPPPTRWAGPGRARRCDPAPRAPPRARRGRSPRRRRLRRRPGRATRARPAASQKGGPHVGVGVHRGPGHGGGAPVGGEPPGRVEEGEVVLLDGDAHVPCSPITKPTNTGVTLAVEAVYSPAAMPIHYEQRRRARRPHHDRPARGAQLRSTWTTSALRGGVGRFRRRPDAWVAIITGVERQLLTGADLKTYIPEITELQKRDRGGERRPRSTATASTTAPTRCCASVKLYKPIIAAVNGSCVAGGMEMLGGVDIRVACPEAQLRGDGAQARPVRRRRHDGAPAPPDPVPRGDGVPAHRRGVPGRSGRCELGLLNEIVPRDELLDARATSGRAASSPTRRSRCRPRRRACCAGLAVDLRRGVQASRASSPATIFQTEDAKEGPKAFAEKRDADLAGHSDCMTVDPRTPCIDRGRRSAPSGRARARSPEPLGMWEDGRPRGRGRRAAAAGDVLDAVDSLQVVYCQTWQYDDPVGRLAERARHRPARTATTRASAARRRSCSCRTPASAILARRAATSRVVTGAEALDTKRRLKKAGERPAVVASSRAETPARSRSRRRSTRPRSRTRCSRRG